MEVAADLVVDAMGRTSRTPSWLDAYGYTVPPTDEVQVDIVYSSLLVERPDDDRRAYFIGPDAPRTRGGAAFPVEDGRYLVNLHGMHGDHPPAEPDPFAEFAATLPVPQVRDILDDHAWVSEDIGQYPFPASRRRRYEKLAGSRMASS